MRPGRVNCNRQLQKVIRMITKSPSNRRRSGGLKIALGCQLQSCALPTELSKARHHCRSRLCSTQSTRIGSLSECTYLRHVQVGLKKSNSITGKETPMDTQSVQFHRSAKYYFLNGWVNCRSDIAYVRQTASNQPATKRIYHSMYGSMFTSH